jgi:hypothetical protein
MESQSRIPHTAAMEQIKLDMAALRDKINTHEEEKRK